MLFGKHQSKTGKPKSSGAADLLEWAKNGQASRDIAKLVKTVTRIDY